MHKEKEREMVGERVRNIRRNVLIVVAKSQLKKERKGERDSEREVKFAKKNSRERGGETDLQRKRLMGENRGRTTTQDVQHKKLFSCHTLNI